MNTDVFAPAGERAPASPPRLSTSPDPQRPHLIFVYGTLRHGQGNWSWALAPAEPLFHARTVPGWELRHLGGFPGMVRSTEDRRVIGEVYAIDDDQLGQIDRLEGHPNFYRREPIEVVDLDREADALHLITVQTYVYRHNSGRLIESGDWMHDRKPGWGWRKGE